MSTSSRCCVVCKKLEDSKGIRLLVCARCKDQKILYCSQVCQIKHWKGGHKKECKPKHELVADMLEQRAAGAGAAAQQTQAQRHLAHARVSAGVCRIPKNQFAGGLDAGYYQDHKIPTFDGDGFIRVSMCSGQGINSCSGQGINSFLVEKEAAEKLIGAALIEQFMSNIGRHLLLMTSNGVYVDIEERKFDLSRLALDKIDIRFKPIDFEGQLVLIFYIPDPPGHVSDQPFSPALREQLDRVIGPDTCECFIMVPGGFEETTGNDGKKVYTVRDQSVHVPLPANGDPPPHEYLHGTPPAETTVTHVLEIGAKALERCTPVCFVNPGGVNAFLMPIAAPGAEGEHYLKRAQEVVAVQELTDNAHEIVFMHKNVRFKSGDACDRPPVHEPAPGMRGMIFRIGYGCVYIFLFKTEQKESPKKASEMSTILTALAKILHLEGPVDTCVIIGGGFQRKARGISNEAWGVEYSISNACLHKDTPLPYIQLPKPEEKQLEHFLKCLLRSRFSKPVCHELAAGRPPKHRACTYVTMITWRGIITFAIKSSPRCREHVLNQILATYLHTPERLLGLKWIDENNTHAARQSENREASTDTVQTREASFVGVDVAIDKKDVCVYCLQDEHARKVTDPSMQNIFTQARSLLGAGTRELHTPELRKRTGLVLIIGAQHNEKVDANGVQKSQTHPGGFYLLPGEEPTRDQWFMHLWPASIVQVSTFLRNAVRQMCVVCGCVELNLHGSALKCGRCRIAVYCGKECQEEHWREHRKVCGKEGPGSGSASGGAADDAGVDPRE